MDTGERGLRWIESEDIPSTFLSHPFPPRPAGAPLGPLVRSIRELGVICPIIARELGGKLQVVCGYRRLLAAQACGRGPIPVILRHLDDEECRRLFLAEERAGGGPSGTEENGGDPAPGRAPAPEEKIPVVGEEFPIDPALRAIARKAETCFRRIAMTRAVPVDGVEELATDLIALAPVRRGFDLRTFCAAGEDRTVAQALIVAGLGIHLAESLDWTPGQVKKFCLACLLHDVGMLFVPKHLLAAPRPLTKEERRMVETHPDLGREVIQRSRAWGAQIHLVAQDHHERWNGTGYPRGKKGQEIDLPSRMVGFLDTLAALISPRPHRAPLLYSEALRLISGETEMGHHDPSVLAHFRRVFTEIPVGSCLLLRDGRVGRVLGSDPRNPSRHRIRLAGEEAPSGVRGLPVWIDSASLVDAEIPPRHPAWAAAGSRIPAAATAAVAGEGRSEGGQPAPGTAAILLAAPGPVA